jgi:branched-chain amino acid transport system permease protein
LLAGAVITGVYGLGGVMIGGVILVAIPEIAESIAIALGGSEGFTISLPDFIVGSLVILTVLFTPHGIGGTLHKKKHHKH